MSDREELRAMAGQCLALARSATDPRKRITLTGMAQKLYEIAGGPAGDFERAQQEFNDWHMQPTAAGATAADNAATTANPTKEKRRIGRLSWRPLSFKSQVRGRLGHIAAQSQCGGMSELAKAALHRHVREGQRITELDASLVK
jgi:hypothetical protein